MDAGSLGFFRIGFGLIMLTEVLRFPVHGWISERYLASDLLFAYPGLEWIRPWPGDGLYWHFGILAALAAMVALGLWYRVAIVGFTLGFAYVFFLDQGSYLNQYYLALLIAFNLCLVPAHRAWSLDAMRERAGTGGRVPRGSLWSLRALFELMLLHAGLVKLNADWLDGQPLGLWLSAHAGLPLIGPWLAEPAVAVAASWGAALLHLIGAPLLLWRRTRLAVFVLYLAFHLSNSMFFTIGMFPWLTLLGTLLFFDPDWPRRIVARLRGEDPPLSRPAAATMEAVSGPAALVLALFLVFQLLFPLRHLLYPGNTAWTGEGDWFAWRMKLHDRRGWAVFEVRGMQEGQIAWIRPEDHLTARQAALLPTRPDMIRRFAHFLDDRWRPIWRAGRVEVRAAVHYSLNGRPPAPLVDPARDLSEVRWSWGHADWLLPLREPLHRILTADQARAGGR